MSVEWLKKHKRIQKQTEPKEEKQKKSSIIKVTASQFLKKTPNAEEEKLKTLELIQSQLKKDQESKREKEQREQELQDEISELSQKEQTDYNELVGLAKQKAHLEVETAQFQKEQAQLTLENEKLVNIQYKQRFEQYVKDMKEAGVTVEVDSDYVRKVLKKDG